jgi:hypothetical protein
MRSRLAGVGGGRSPAQEKSPMPVSESNFVGIPVPDCQRGNIMMRIAPEISSASIVLVGSFNPPIFHPAWFAKNGLITDQENENAEIEIIHQEITLFRLEWLSIRIEPQRFIVETQQAPFIRLSDLVVKTFKECLNHTPISKLGINRMVHFSVGSEEMRNRIGKTLAPHEPWGEWAAAITGKSAGKRGGLRSLIMEQQDLDDRAKGHIQAHLEPSLQIKFGVGISIRVNDHYEVENPEQTQGCEELIGLLESRFDTSIKRSEWIIDQIMALKEKL